MPSIFSKLKPAVPYAVGSTKRALDVFSKCASIVHPPCVKAAIDTASQIISIIEVRGSATPSNRCFLTF